MVQFAKLGTSTVYPADSNSQGFGWWAFVLTDNGRSGQKDDPPNGPLSLSAALDWVGQGWKSSFVYVLSNAEQIESEPAEFTAKIQNILDASLNDGALVFLPTGEIDQIKRGVGAVFEIARNGAEITIVGPPRINLTGGPGVDALFATGAILSVPTDASESFIQLSPTGSHPAIELGGPHAPQAAIPPSRNADLHFDGDANGAFRFSLLLLETELTTETNMGFQIVIPNDHKNNPTGESADLLSAYFPLAETRNDEVFVEFAGQLNPLDPNNLVHATSETSFEFTGISKGVITEPTSFVTFYRTNYGKKIILTPSPKGQNRARLVFNPAPGPSLTQNGFRLSPVGDFAIGVEGASTGEFHKLLCGLSGTETVAVIPEIPEEQAGESIRFTLNSAGNVPVFPLQSVSPVGPPIDPTAPLMSDTYKTSWVSFLSPTSGPSRTAHYAAAPKGAELFGLQTSQASGFLGPEDPGVGLPENGEVSFPMLPLAGFTKGTQGVDVTKEQLELISQQIVSPTRKNKIDAASTRSMASAQASLMPHLMVKSADLISTTTPTGFITRYGSDRADFKQLLLAQIKNASGAVTRQMGFTKLGANLQSAFQTNDQFLILANNKDNRLGAAPPDDLAVFMPPSLENIVEPSYFFDAIDIGDWSFAASVGTDNEYGDYRNVVIVKGVKGKIFEPDPNSGKATEVSLVRSPDKWTMKEVFASPDPDDPSQLMPLSNWMADYCAEAYEKRDNPYFKKFAQIITDENWTGVLVLKANISAIPTELAGIMAGVNNPDLFFAHHIGVEIGQIEPTQVEQKDTTSVFGLVYYVDPRYDDSLPAHTIPAANLSADYDFTLLTLKALFENSTVKKFESLAQVTLNKIFGSTVTEMYDVFAEGAEKNTNHAVLLQGGVQKNGDATIYSLASKWPNQYLLQNNVLTSVEIDTAQMSTRDDGSESGTIVSWIGMTGFMNYAVMPAPPPPEGQDPLPTFDIFSFGPEPEERSGDSIPLRRGLNFNNLGLLVTALVDPPDDGTASILELREDEINFNVEASHARNQSIFKGFQLELLGLLSGSTSPEDEADRSDPSTLGFLPAVTQYNLRGVAGGAGGWHGMHFKLNLGTPGSLAGKVNLDSSMLVAWADDSGASDDGKTFNAFVGIELPGTGSGGELFSLQTVIKLSVGLIQLDYTAPDLANNNPGGYLLVLNEIALKLLGLLKIPPSGNTAFMLFGNQDATDTTGLGWFAIYNQAKAAETQDSLLDAPTSVEDNSQ